LSIYCDVIIIIFEQLLYAFVLENYYKLYYSDLMYQK